MKNKNDGAGRTSEYEEPEGMRTYKVAEVRGRCLECGDVISFGRPDKKFCCLSCKSRYHYESTGRLARYKLRLVGWIDHNYDILESILSCGETSKNITDLEAAGYRFDCVTMCRKVRNRNEYRCYDIKYYMSDVRIYGVERTDVTSLLKR